MTIKPSKKIIITGTHLTPAIELIHQLQSDPKFDWDISYIGRLFNSATNKIIPIESKIIPNLGINFYPINSGKFDRKFFWNNFFELPEIFKGFFDAQKIISKIKPDIIVSFGGYVSVPVIINGFFKKIPSITHEQTPTTSLTTKINSFFVNKIALSFKTEKSFFPHKTIITGNLLRSEIYNQKSLFFENCKLKIINSPLIYITAGNQGSQTINKLIPEIIRVFPKINFIHQTGETDFQKMASIAKKHQNYFVFDYINLDNIGWVLNKSDIIIGRSGANTSQEIVALQKKSILVPLPKSQQNEQMKNALWIKEQLEKQTIIIPQEKLNLQSLAFSIEKLLETKNKSKTGKIQINTKLLNLIHETL